jgi:transposase
MAVCPQELDLTEIDEILLELKATMDPAKWAKLGRLRDRYVQIVQILKHKKSVIRKLQKLIFGPSSEKTGQLIGESSNEKPADKGKTDDGEAPKKKGKRRGGKPKGSGRLGARDYPGAREIPVDHSALACGDDCPDCGRGFLGELQRRAPSLFLYAQAPIAALLFMLQVLRCSHCGREFRAPLPGAAAIHKHDPSVAAMLALLRYVLGVPHNRIEKLQKLFGIPIPSSTQWDVLRVYEPQLRAIFEQLVREAAQGDLVHNDDTVMRVLELLKDIRLEKANDPKARTGVFTTNIVSRAQGRQIVLFLTGRRHAGENLGYVLSFRDASLQNVLQMCDGLEHNQPADIATILCNCLTHGRRQFVDIIVDFPEEVRRVLQDIKKVYQHEETTQKEGMTPEQRLAYHQEHSKPILDDLKLWFEELQRQKLVEPNSGLGKAIKYMLKRWDKLTRFLTVVGAPIDNNVAERALKMAIVHRKNSQYYRSVVGARLGDCIMSLGNTCLLGGINPYEYLVALFTHIDIAATEPRLWMPWSFEKRLAELEGGMRPSISQWAATLGADRTGDEPASPEPTRSEPTIVAALVTGGNTTLVPVVDSGPPGAQDQAEAIIEYGVSAIAAQAAESNTTPGSATKTRREPDELGLAPFAPAPVNPRSPQPRDCTAGPAP